MRGAIILAAFGLIGPADVMAQERMRPPATAPLPPEKMVPPLIEALKDSDFEVRQYVGIALAAIGRPAVPALTQALKGPDRSRRAGAAYALGLLGPAAADTLPALLDALKDDDREVRRQVALAISRIVAAPAPSAPPKPQPQPPPPEPFPTTPGAPR